MNKYTRLYRQKTRKEYQKIINLFDKSSETSAKTEVLSGFTVAFTLIPEEVAFAFLAGLSPLTELFGAIVMCFVTAILGGRPGMISGAAGATAIVIIALVQSHGFEYVLATVILAGILQMMAGAMRLGKLIRLVPHPVIFGFVNGLAIIIFTSQIDQFKDPAGNWLTGTRLYILLALVALTILIIWFLPKRSEEHTSELQSRGHLVCRLLLEKKKKNNKF